MPIPIFNNSWTWHSIFSHLSCNTSDGTAYVKIFKTFFLNVRSYHKHTTEKLERKCNCAGGNDTRASVMNQMFLSLRGDSFPCPWIPHLWVQPIAEQKISSRKGLPLLWTWTDFFLSLSHKQYSVKKLYLHCTRYCRQSRSKVCGRMCLTCMQILECFT